MLCHLYLIDADFQMVSQALNDKTMVGLARTPNADIRFFRKPPKLPTNKVFLPAYILLYTW